MPPIAEQEPVEAPILDEPAPVGRQHATLEISLSDLREQEARQKEERERKETEDIRAMFDDLKNVDAVSPFARTVISFLKEPDEARARMANVFYLSKHYGRSPEDVNRDYPLY